MTSSSRRLKIGVLGPHKCTDEERSMGLEVGEEIARRGEILVCGGLNGMMEAAAEGAKKAGGLTVGILPGDTADEANPFVDIALPTGLGAFRNMLLVRACDAVIAVRGEYGTLSEIAAALRLKVPVVGLQTWKLIRNGLEDPGLHVAATPREAVELALQLAVRPRLTGPS
ncbi:MAG: TIGR00725 family protein [Verrucomicrobia bacterium]|nr:TIGR00725 family protein [Verrucomicrobiota bacterium]